MARGMAAGEEAKTLRIHGGAPVEPDVRVRSAVTSSPRGRPRSSRIQVFHRISRTGQMRWRDVATELEGRPGYRAAFERQFPYANVALAVVALRERHGLTQRALAELVGTAQPVVARLESGRHPVEIKMLARIADAVGETWTVSTRSSTGNDT